MCDLKEFAEDFIQKRLSPFAEDDREDKEAIQAIDDRGMDRAVREKGILDWLNHYRVLLFFPPDNIKRIAGEIIGFADERQRTTLHLSKDSIVSEYVRLRDRIHQFAPIRRSGKRKEVTSLASKALVRALDRLLWDLGKPSFYAQ